MTSDQSELEAARREADELRLRLEEAEATISAIRTGQVDALVVTRLGREEVFTLETADRPYRLFVESMQQGAVTIADDGTILFCNAYFVTLLKIPAERLAGTSFPALLTEEDRPRFDSILNAGHGEVTLRGDGTTRVPVALRIHVLSPHAQESMVCVLVTDLTEQKHYEQLQRTQAVLKEREEELRSTATQLTDANRRKDEFLATLAHELRNPLAPIRSGLELMSLAKDDPEILEQTRGIMEQQVEQMVRLIDDLLDVSRITRGRLELRRSRVELADVIRTAVEASRPFITQAGHELTTAQPDGPIYLEADPSRLTQVISNLLNNAAKFTNPHGRIELSTERLGDGVRLTVKDNGIGIPAEMLEQIFEMFTQVDYSQERGSAGLGIGLTLVRQIVEMHGGTVTVASNGENQGSAFIIFLPFPHETRLTEKPLQKNNNALKTGNGCRVLIVDDNQAALDTLSMLVRTLGNHVQTAADGQEATAVAAEFLPQVVLMDLGMPRMDGYAAARYIREQPWGREMLLVALTGWGQETDRQRTKEAGFDHHLVKPARPADVQKLLADVAGKAE